MENVIQQIKDIALIALPIIGVIALIYLVFLLRQLTITSKKVDYFVEDMTYKSEMLNSTVETVVKVSNYIDAFEAITKKNAKAAIRFAARNRDVAYKLVDRVRDFANKND